jgi:DNA-binding MarR family transcriptional regulator/GNAT superfamily N-acetyltransferase
MSIIATTTPTRIATVRAFNRFYTRRFGMLRAGLLGTRHPLPQARVLYELGQRPVTPVAELRRTLNLDAGYLSRLLAGLEADGLVARTQAPEDARRRHASLTTQGREAFAELDARSAAEAGGLLEQLTDQDQRRVLAAMHAIEAAWDGASPPRSFTLRDPRPGEHGWIVERHGALYAREYAFDESFEARVARIVDDYLRGRDPARERAWIADVAGEPAGCVLCTRHDDDVAELRVLLVEPDARGMGIGARLVQECVEFARRAGYASLRLWTLSILTDARRLYQRAGFALIDEEEHHSFGRDLVGETWELSRLTRT